MSLIFPVKTRRVAAEHFDKGTLCYEKLQGAISLVSLT